MLKYLSTILMVVGMMNAVFAQDHVSQTDPIRIFQDALELYHKQKFSAAKSLFDKFIHLDEGSERSIQSVYYRNVCDLKLMHPDFEKNMTAFIASNPNHPYAVRANADIGSYYFEHGEYTKAIKFFAKGEGLLDMTNPANFEKLYQLAYAYFQTNQMKKAKKRFDYLKKGVHEYAYKSSYYAGYLAYQENDLETAETDLNKASQDPDIRPDTYVMIPGIYYKRGNYGQVIDYVKDMETNNDRLPLDLYVLVGESYFQHNDFQNTEKYIGYYIKNHKIVDRGINYRMGYALFKTKQINEAVGYLSKAADGQDSLAQVSAYHLGISYITLKEKELAIAAFDKCRTLDFDKRMQELGAFYYTKVTFDAGDYTATIKGSEFYFDNFAGNTEHLQDVFHYSTMAYQNTGDYDKALEYFAKIQNKTRSIKEAYQEVAYNKAVEEYNDGRYEQAVGMLKKSLTYTFNKETEAASYYWLGEIYAIDGKYDKSLSYYNNVSQSAELYPLALYGKAYSYYGQKDYEKAKSTFISYLTHNKAINRDRKADAYTRLGDCYYVTKKYQDAIKNYNLAVSSGSKNLDYILYQKGVTYKAEGAQNKAVKTLKMVAKNFPRSSYIDKALYEVGSIYMKNNRWRDAINSFSTIINSYGNSELLETVYLKRALAFTNMGMEDMAWADYKAVLDISLTSEAAEEATHSMFSLNRVDPKEMQRYKAMYRKANPGQKSIELLRGEFEQAEKLLTTKEYKKAVNAFKSLVNIAPNTDMKDDAYLSLAEAYKRLGQVQQSIDAYAKVEGVKKKPKAVRYMADLYYKTRQFASAINAYEELKDISNKRLYTELAYGGLMKSYYLTSPPDLESSELYANKIIKEKSRRFSRDAELFKGKIKFKQAEIFRGPAEEKKAKYDEAIVELQKITVKSSAAERGAEAQFLIGKALRMKGDFETSTAELINVRKKYTSYIHWVYEAYILVAQNYFDQGNAFQARRTLESVIQATAEDFPEYKKKAQDILDLIDIHENNLKEEQDSINKAQPEIDVVEEQGGDETVESQVEAEEKQKPSETNVSEGEAVEEVEN